MDELSNIQLYFRAKSDSIRRLHCNLVQCMGNFFMNMCEQCKAPVSSSFLFGMNLGKGKSAQIKSLHENLEEVRNLSGRERILICKRILGDKQDVVNIDIKSIMLHNAKLLKYTDIERVGDINFPTTAGLVFYLLTTISSEITTTATDVVPGTCDIHGVVDDHVIQALCAKFPLNVDIDSCIQKRLELKPFKVNVEKLATYQKQVATLAHAVNVCDVFDQLRESSHDTPTGLNMRVLKQHRRDRISGRKLKDVSS